MSSWSYEQLNNWYYVLLLWGEIILCKDILSVALFADWPQIFSSYVLVFVASVGSLSLPPSLSSLTSLDQKSLQQMIQCLQGDPRAFPYQMGYLNPAACFWSSPLLSSSQWLKITSWRRCKQMSESPHLAPVNKAKHWLCVRIISLSYFKT